LPNGASGETKKHLAPSDALPRNRRLCYDGSCNHPGEVTEWFKVLASKASVRETVPWVRIPPSPPYQVPPLFYVSIDTLLPLCFRFSSLIWDGVQHVQRIRKIQMPPGMRVSQ